MLELVDELGRTERDWPAAKARAAAWAVETYAYRIDSCPATREALSAGELSLDQAHEITLTEAEVPGSEGEMLRAAKRQALKKLRERGLEKRLRHKHPEDLTRTDNFLNSQQQNIS